MTEEELLDERAGIAGLVFERRVETTKRGVVVDRYRFQPQDNDIDERDELFEPGSEKPTPIARVESIDLEHTTIDLRKGVARANHHPKAGFNHDKISNPDGVDALLRIGEFVRDHSVDGPGTFRAARVRSRDHRVPGRPSLAPERSLTLFEQESGSVSPRTATR
jgi:uncharacterized protein